MSARLPIHHDLEAEEAFVGCLLCSEGRALDDLPTINANDLCHSYLAQCVLRELVDSHAKGRPNEIGAVSNRLSAARLYTSPTDGGWDAVVTRLLQLGVPSLAGYYHGVLSARLAVRRMEALSRWLGAQINSSAEPVELLAETSRRLALVEPQADASDHALPAVVASISADIRDRREGRTERTLTTPLNVWNDAFGGLPQGAYLALGGRPGSGKSAMMEQILFHLMQNDHPVCVFEKDMPLKMFVTRMACRCEGVPFWKFQKGFTSRDEEERIRLACDTFLHVPFRLHNPAKLTAETLASIVRREKRQHGVRAVFLDHIQLLYTAPGQMREGLTQQSMAIRASASETEIPHVVLFQLNRNATTGRPDATHVKEFDQLLADVDGMAMLWTDADKTALKPGQKLPMKFYTPKNRAGGETEEDVDFDGPRLTFVNRAPDHTTSRVGELRG